MLKQNRLPGMKSIRPPKPTLRDESVARKIAEKLVAAVNLDDFYWESHEIPDRIWDVQQEIMRNGRVATVFDRLYRQQAPLSCAGERGGAPYGWEGIQEHCRHVAPEIAKDVLADALFKWKQRYEV